MKLTIPIKALIISLVFCLQPLTVCAQVTDIFITAGQSNAGYNDFEWYDGIKLEIIRSGVYSNPVVLPTAHFGRPLNEWFDDGTPGPHYKADFFNSDGTGVLQREINRILEAGGTPRFRGLFWFQGEADGRGKAGGSAELYPSRWQGMMDQLSSDVGNSDWNYLMNTVGNSGHKINEAFKSITDADSRGILFDAQKYPYKVRPGDIHGYDHELLGKDNVALFNAEFVPEPSSSLLMLSSLALLLTHRKRISF